MVMIGQPFSKLLLFFKNDLIEKGSDNRMKTDSTKVGKNKHVTWFVLYELGVCHRTEEKKFVIELSFLRTLIFKNSHFLLFFIYLKTSCCDILTIALVLVCVLKI